MIENNLEHSLRHGMDRQIAIQDWNTGAVV